MTQWLQAIALLCGANVAQAQSDVRYERDMAALSTDAMEGRRPGTRGEKRAVAYIARAFRDAGLEPVKGRRWLQPVRLEERIPRATTVTLRRGDVVTNLSQSVLLLGERSRTRIANASIVYGGHAEAGTGYAGAVVLYRDRPRPGSTLRPDSDGQARLERLAKGGALVALSVVDARQLARLRQRAALGVITGANATRPALHGYIEEAAAQSWLKAGGLSLETLDKAATSAGFTPVPLADATAAVETTTKLRRFTSFNVVGQFKGAREPAKAILYTAHWDAFGYCRPGEADAICNGAVDNASGVAGIIALARRFAAGLRPDRTILFVATTAEEHNLLGSRAWVGRPPVPLRDTVAAINIDTIALYGRGHPIGFVGAGLTDADALIARLAAGQGRKLDAGEGANFVARSSDAWPLMQAGVPAFILSGAIARSGPDGGAAFQRFITERAHFPTDEMKGVDLGGALEDLDLAFALGADLARRDATVNFLPTSPFQRQR